MKKHPFTRPTLIAAIEFLGARLTQAQFDQLIVRLNLSNHIPLGSGKSVTAKSALLGNVASQYSESVIATIDGQMTLTEAIVRAATGSLVYRNNTTEQESFLRGLSLDGYVIDWDNDKPWLRAALPQEISLPDADDEVHRLLKHFCFNVPLGHLDQAIDAHTRGDWAAANSQIRSFLEGLLDCIAHQVDQQKCNQIKSSENRRSMLAEVGFLSKNRNEWTQDGKNYVNGLFKMLHTDGSHPGLSDEDHSTFRLHLGLITGRVFLRRLYFQP